MKNNIASKPFLRGKGRNYQQHADYKYIPLLCAFTANLLIFSQDPDSIIKTLEENYKYKLGGVGTPEYCNGADISFDGNGYAQMSANMYIKNVTERIEKLLQCTLKNYGSPMETGDHPELDESDFLPPTDIPIYQMLLDMHNGQKLLED